MILSIIIAVKTWQKNLEECVKKCAELDFPQKDFEILVMTDEPPQSSIVEAGRRIFSNISFHSTGNVNPAKKRDASVQFAKGTFLAFLDDDAYPQKYWARNGLKNFDRPEVAAVGGPAVTPPSDSLRQKISGEIYSSLLVSGNYYYRYLPGRILEVEDFPSCNLFLRKSVMEELGGFKTDFWPGEDTKLCRDIIKKGGKIIYDPAVLVYHHRRRAFLPHLTQIANYALHRGYFVKRFPETSFKIAYFIPSLFLVFIIGGALISCLFLKLMQLYLGLVIIYLCLVLISSIFSGLRHNCALSPLKKALLISGVFVGIILTHAYYGFFFVKGLFSTRLREES